MSRSYRKFVVWKDHNKYAKQNANRKVRRFLKRNPNFTISHKEYKKLFDSYDICDFRNYVGDFESYFASIVENWYRMRNLGFWKNKPFPDKKHYYRKWLNVKGK